jgi:hypothetical protein
MPRNPPTDDKCLYGSCVREDDIVNFADVLIAGVLDVETDQSGRQTIVGLLSHKAGVGWITGRGIL